MNTPAYTRGLLLPLLALSAFLALLGLHLQTMTALGALKAQQRCALAYVPGLVEIDGKKMNAMLSACVVKKAGGSV